MLHTLHRSGNNAGNGDEAVAFVLAASLAAAAAALFMFRSESCTMALFKVVVIESLEDKFLGTDKTENHSNAYLLCLKRRQVISSSFIEIQIAISSTANKINVTKI